MFSVDVEDVRDQLCDGYLYSERVPAMLEKYLNFLDQHQAKATFFVVGNVARKYPHLIREILSKGHEVGAHGNDHTPLDNLGVKRFGEDLKKNIEHLNNCGVEHVLGYRAPIFSLTQKTQWAYEVLERLGFCYSSSVLPGRNPLYGWPEFGTQSRKINNIWELPMSVAPFKYFKIPYSGGVYFRVLPFWLTSYFHKRSLKKHDAIFSYFHPYDVDTEQEKFMHPGISNSRFFNHLMYFGRDPVFAKLAKVIKKTDSRIIPYINFVNQLERNNGADRRKTCS